MGFLFVEVTVASARLLFYRYMDAKQKIINLLQANYEPCSSIEDADITVTATSLFNKLQAVLPDLETPNLVAACLDELGYTIADQGELDFVWMLKQKPVL